MALAVYDRIQEVTATTGTGTITLGGAVTGYQSFSAIGDGNTTFYTILNGTQWEVGIGTYSSTGPTLARTTILSNSNADTSPITLSGGSNVWCDYPAEKAVYLNASGNVSPLGIVSSGAWQGTTVGVAYGGTGVTASSGANSVVLRDASSNVLFNNYIAGAVGVTAAAGTTVLTVASARTQILVGSTTQTFQLPDATTVGLGQSFIFVNNSSGLLTVKNNAGTTIETVPSGGVTQMGAVNIATSAGSWGSYSFIPAAVNWGTNSLDLVSTVITGGSWQGGTIGTAYGGTGLTSFISGGALYASSTSALTTGTLPVPSGGTGQTSFSSGYIPYGNTTAALQSSALLQFNGSYLVVGGGGALGGATNPIAAFSQSANNYVQTYTYNPSNGTSGSSDFVAYTDNSTDTHGWGDMGYTSSTYADPVYTITGPNEAYLLGSAPSASGTTGNLVYATDNTGTANAHQWYVGGFTQAKSAWKMQLTSTGLQLANALSATYGGTGATSAQGGMNALAGAVTSGYYLRGNGTNVVMSAIQAADVPTLNQNTTGSAGSVANAVTFNNGGTGAASGTTFDGSVARTISYNTIGAAPAGGGTTITSLGTVTTGTWNANVIAATYGGTGVAGTLTGLAYMNGASAYTAATGAQISSALGSTAISGASGSVANALTINSSGTGDVSGSTYNGSATKTISYNSIGASPLAGSSSLTTTGTVTSGTWSASFGAVSGANLTNITGANVTGTVANATNATTATTATNQSGGTVSATTGAFSTGVTITSASGVNPLIVRSTSSGYSGYYQYTNTASTTSFSILTNSTENYLATGCYYNGSTWIFNQVGGASLFRLSEQAGAYWFSGNGASYNNVVNNTQLWNQSGIWTNSVSTSSSVTASSFTGAGTGLTGTAASLSIGGNAATATTATSVAGLVANASSTYGNVQNSTAKNGWYGILNGPNSAYATVMFDPSGGGIYRESSAYWALYTSYANLSVGIGASTTSSSYALYVTGQIYATNNITAYSDKRKKENIVTIENGLEKVCKMRGVYYNKIDDKKKTRQIGVIAQEMEEVMPEAVSYAPDVDEYGVYYGNLVGVLIEAVKDLKAETNSLKAEIEALKFPRTGA